MALKRCTSTEMRWYKKLASQDSPVLAEILKPISFNRLLAEELKTPRVSTAIGSYYYYYYYYYYESSLWSLLMCLIGYFDGIREYLISTCTSGRLNNPDNPLFDLLPPPRDAAIIGRLRSAHLLPVPRTRTTRYRSFIHHGLIRYTTQN